MATFFELGYPNYEAYLKGWQFRKVKRRVLNGDKRNRCWICEKTYTLIVHHEIYTNLGNERLGRDVFRICWKCHNKLHFALFGLIKVSLNRYILRMRRRFLRANYCVQKLRFFTASWHYLTCVIPL